MTTNWAENLWNRLTEPEASLTDPEDRRNARLLSSLLVVLIPLGYFLSVIPSAVTSSGPIWLDGGFWIINVSTLLLVVIYLASHGPYYRRAVQLAIAVGMAGILLPVIVQQDATLAGVDYLLILVVFSSMFLGVTATFGLVVIAVAGTLALPFFVRGVAFGDLLTSQVAYLVIGAGLVLLAARHRDQVEKGRRAALTASEARYRLLFESNPLPMWVLDSDKLRFLAVNEAAVTHYGYTQDEFRAMTIRDIQPPEELRRLETSVPEPRLRQEWAGDWKHCAKDGRLMDVQIISHEIQFLNRPARLMLANDITLRKQGEAKIHRQVEHLTALGEIDRAISSSFDLDVSLGTLLNHVTLQLRVDAADVLMFGSGSYSLEFKAGRGFRTKALQYTQLRLGEGYAGRAALERAVVHVPNLALQHDNPRLAKLLEDEHFISYYGVPLTAKGQVNGVLEVFHRAPFEPDEEWLDFLKALAEQAAIAIDNATLFDRLQRSNTELTLAYDATIEGWSRALDLRDKETEGHTKRVADMSVRLARTFGISEADLVQIRWGALLHDMGKMGVRDEILFKPGPLTEEEWALMKKHPTFAYEMLAPIRYLRSALDIPYYHHEKWDGTGYPLGLEGEQIPLSARIFAVVDSWDALSFDRPYRAAWPREKVREHIRSLAGKHFEVQVVNAFLELDLATSDTHT